ncbi:MAG TPA: hypothetical protein VK941_13540 [Gillisia sp.]|nr:hypothetical protein [Gillisia sp.]
MIRKITFALAFLLLTTACSRVTPPAKENMLKNKSFVYLFVSTEKECLESQPEPGFFYNCHQQVDFYKDNNVEIMLTDIIYRGKYEMQGNTVILTFEPAPEIPNGVFLFEVLNGAKLLELNHEIEQEKVWTKISGNSIWR